MCARRQWRGAAMGLLIGIAAIGSFGRDASALPPHQDVHAPVVLVKAPKPPIPAVPKAPAGVVLHEQALGPPPTDAGYRQQGNRVTPWGEAKTLPPQSEPKRLWRIANRLNPGYSKAGTDAFVAAAANPAQARHNNCVLASMSFEDSMEGHPTVAMPGRASSRVTDTDIAAAKARFGNDFASRYTGKEADSVIYATRYPKAVFERSDDYHTLENRLTQSGPGSRLVFRASWIAKNGATGGHAINMVNEGGTVVVVDTQSGTVSKPAEYFKYSTWSDFRYHVTAEGGPAKSLFAQADTANATAP